MNKKKIRIKKYLDRVVDILVDETRIDYENEGIDPPFFISSSYHSQFSIWYPHAIIPFRFIQYCEDTYGLTEEEIKYVWEQYSDIIINKIDEE